MEKLQAKSSNSRTKETVKKISQRKPPVVKQTLTSMYRLAKANPLLIYGDPANENHGNSFGLNHMQLPKSVLLPTRSVSNNIKPTPSSTNQLSFNASAKPLTVLKNTANKNKETTKAVMKKNESTNSNNAQSKRSNSIRRRNMPVANSNPTMKTGVAQKLPRADKKTVPKQNRRSLSAEHYERKKWIPAIETPHHIDINDLGSQLPPTVSPIVENVRTVTFKTPSAHQRRSISMTSITPTPFHTHIASTPRPTGLDLQHRLEQWLRDHKKSLDSYKHLRCFGHSNHRKYDTVDDENKENVEATPNLSKSTSYEDLKITVPKNATATSGSTIACENEIHFTDNRTIAQNALVDLHKLILAGYPHQYCEVWLGMIRRKYRDLDEEAQYWECRAAIEQNRGNITSAVECLRTAIVQGAEVNAVDHSLEQLLQKFSLLNISTSNDKNDIKGIDRERIVLDARNVFKSSIIQFAVQERRLKKNDLQVASSEKRFIATPVRRSTRHGRSRYLASPGVQLCTSLHELDENICNSVEFHRNVAFL